MWKSQLSFLSIVIPSCKYNLFPLSTVHQVWGASSTDNIVTKFCFRQEHLKISQLTWFYPITKEANNLALKSSRESSAKEQSNSKWSPKNPKSKYFGRQHVSSGSIETRSVLLAVNSTTRSQYLTSWVTANCHIIHHLETWNHSRTQVEATTNSNKSEKV